MNYLMLWVIFYKMFYFFILNYDLGFFYLIEQRILCIISRSLFFLWSSLQGESRSYNSLILLLESYFTWIKSASLSSCCLTNLLNPRRITHVLLVFLSSEQQIKLCQHIKIHHLVTMFTVEYLLSCKCSNVPFEIF